MSDIIGDVSPAATPASGPAIPPVPVRGAAVSAEGWGWRHAGRKAWALRELSLSIEPGERVLLLGASGAGKSTLLHGMAGILGGEEDGESSGSLTVDGRDAAAARADIGLVMQDPEAQVVLARIGDDVAFGCENLGLPRDEIWRRVRSSLTAVGLGGLPLGWPTARMSGGQKQRLALASVLAMGPRLLLLDEPTANLDPSGVAEVRAAAEKVVDQTGATLVVIEHRVDVWADLVDRVVVILDGRVAADGPPSEILTRESERLRAAGIWLPGDEARIVEEVGEPPAREAQENAAVLAADDLTIGYDDAHPVRSGIDLGIAPGASTCIVGANGAGKTTLALTLAGLLPPLAGDVAVSEALAGALKSRDPRDWRSKDLLGRISMVFQEPEYQFVTATVREELALGPATAGVEGAELDALVNEYLEKLALTRLAQAHPMTLSGGEKRRLSVATALISAPDVVLLDEPTFGQDRTTWIELVRILRGAVGRGTTLVSITHDAAFVRAMGDRVIDLDDVGSDARKPADPAPTPDAGGTGGAPDAGDDPVAEVLADRERRGLIHRVNPVTQFLAVFIMALPLMLSVDPITSAVALGLEVLLLPATGVRARTLAFRMIPLFIAAPLAAISMLLYANPGGEILWQWGPAIISENSVALAGGIVMRVLAIGLPALAILPTIDPTDMADGLGQILHLPPRPVLASLAAIRMSKLMVDDWRALERARRIRGIGDGNRFVLFFKGAFALLVFALRRSSKLSLTMEARGFGATGRERTWARPSKLGLADLVMVIVAAAIPAIALGTSLALGTFRMVGR